MLTNEKFNETPFLVDTFTIHALEILKCSYVHLDT